MVHYLSNRLMEVCGVIHVVLETLLANYVVTPASEKRKFLLEKKTDQTRQSREWTPAYRATTTDPRDQTHTLNSTPHDTPGA